MAAILYIFDSKRLKTKHKCYTIVNAPIVVAETKGKIILNFTIICVKKLD